MNGLALITILFLTHISWGQVPNLKSDCPPLQYSYLLDATAQKASVDSVTYKLSGEWQLIEVRSTSYKPEKVPQLVKMTIDQNKQGKVYQNGKQSSTLNLTLSRGVNRIDLAFTEDGRKPFFGILHNKGHLLICDDLLLVHSARSDETEYVFKRLLINYNQEK